MSSRPIKVSYIGPSGADGLALQQLVAGCDAQPIEFTWADNLNSGFGKSGPQPDVFLVDHVPERFDGLGRVADMTRKACKTPVILIASEKQRSIAAEALRAGAIDSLFREQLSSPLLERAIRYAVQMKQAEEAVRQGLKMEAVGKLMGGVAHSLNNLLTSVLGFSEILLTMKLSEEGTRDALNEIKKAGERAVALIAQLVAFSRRQVSGPNLVELNAVISGMESLLRCAVGSGVEVALDLDPTLLPVHADMEELLQIVLTLGLNAREALPRGSRLLIKSSNASSDDPVLQVKADESEQRYVVMTLQDVSQNASGFPLPQGEGREISQSKDATVMAPLCDAFLFRGSATNGQGLLLAGVSRLVNQCGGFTAVTSLPSGGTEFLVYLPAVERRQQSQAQPAGAPSPRGEKTVLLVDDEDAVRCLSRKILQNRGYTVLEAAQGQEALTVSQDYGATIDLLVSDYQMPEMNGRQLADRLLRLRPGLRVLFLSGCPDIDREITYGGAACSFLSKPFLPNELTAKVEELLAS